MKSAQLKFRKQGGFVFGFNFGAISAWDKLARLKQDNDTGAARKESGSDMILLRVS